MRTVLADHRARSRDGRVQRSRLPEAGTGVDVLPGTVRVRTEIGGIAVDGLRFSRGVIGRIAIRCASIRTGSSAAGTSSRTWTGTRWGGAEGDGRPLAGVRHSAWGGRLIRGWDEEWFELPLTSGTAWGPRCSGPRPGQTVVGDSTTRAAVQTHAGGSGVAAGAHGDRRRPGQLPHRPLRARGRRRERGLDAALDRGRLSTTASPSSPGRGGVERRRRSWWSATSPTARGTC